MTSQRRVIQIDVLPDDVLLDIFDFYVVMRPQYQNKRNTEIWQSLVHVCRRWRCLVLGSSRRLNLEPFCSLKTPARDTLDIWPALPLIVEDNYMDSSSGADNLIAALGQSNRVCKVVISGQLEKVVASMQVPFPELTDLSLISDGETLPVIPDLFLDGSAPRLQRITLFGIPFPGLPNLLLSATYLVKLKLHRIPHSGYFSPNAIVTVISVLSSLKRLSLEFRSPQSRPDWETRRPPPSKRSVIPALTSLYFRGVIEYLEDLVTLTDAPQLERMDVTVFSQINFDTPRLAQFINRTPKLWKPDAHVHFDDYSARVALRSEEKSGYLEIRISCKEPDWQLSSIEQVCNSSLHPLSTVGVLYINHEYWGLVWKNDAIENTQWLQLLSPFTAVKKLYLYKEFAPGIAAALQELVGGRITEVLPSLQDIFVEGLEPWGSFQENIGEFVAARQLANHPITISDWDRKDSDKAHTSVRNGCTSGIPGCTK